MDLGCNYLKELHSAGNATYSSTQIIGEFLQSISRQVEEDTLQQLALSTYFSIMTDESTDISVLKQLVLVVCYLLPTGNVTISFLAIDDLPDGTAETIEAAI